MLGNPGNPGKIYRKTDMPVRGNFGEIAGFLARSVHATDFDRMGLAGLIFDALAGSIHARFLSGIGSRGAFAPNAGEYGEKKRAAGKPPGIGLGPGGGAMARLENFLGQRTATAEEASLEFGADAWDAQKAEWFHFGTKGPGRRRQVPREFFEPTPEDERLIMAILNTRVETFLSAGR